MPWSEYDKVARTLRSWQKRYRGVGKLYWQQMADSAITISTAMVKYASSGNEKWLFAAAEEGDRLDSLIEQHCHSDEYFDIIKRCS